ncbi:MAG: hypothetical protein GY810_16690 [Aureispira sp.]|nr:hypothetical protein [Aureispira sp.]
MLENALKKAFYLFSESLKLSNEQAFSDLWTAQGYSNNLSGEKGAAGTTIFRQALQGNWTLKADFETAQLFEEPMACIVACHPQQRGEDDPMATLYALLMFDDLKMQFFFLGVSEKIEEVQELYRNYKDDKEAIEELPIDEPKGDVMEHLFAQLNEALVEKSEKLFQNLWIPEGYQDNLSGYKGWPGHAIYQQGTAQNWELVPDMETVSYQKEPNLATVVCEIKHREFGMPIKEVWMLLVQRGALYRILGVSQDLTDINNLQINWSIRHKPQKKALVED